MEDEEDRFLSFGTFLLFDIFLVLVEQFRMEFDVSRLIDTVDVAEARSDREVRADLLEGSVDLVNILGLRVEGVVVDVFVVDAILFTTSNSNFLSRH